MRRVARASMLLSRADLRHAQAYTGIYQAESEYRSLKAALDQELQHQADQRRSLESTERLEASTLQEQEQQTQVTAGSCLRSSSTAHHCCVLCRHSRSWTAASMLPAHSCRT